MIFFTIVCSTSFLYIESSRNLMTYDTALYELSVRLNTEAYSGTEPVECNLKFPVEMGLLNTYRNWTSGNWRYSHLEVYICSPNKIHNVVLMSKFYSALLVSSTCFGPHWSIIRSVLYKLYSQTLVCGNTRTTRHVQPLLCNSWTCRVVRTVAPHTKSANTACTKRSWWWTGEVCNMSS